MRQSETQRERARELAPSQNNQFVNQPEACLGCLSEVWGLGRFCCSLTAVSFAGGKNQFPTGQPFMAPTRHRVPASPRPPSLRRPGKKRPLSEDQIPESPPPSRPLSERCFRCKPSHPTGGTFTHVVSGFSSGRLTNHWMSPTDTWRAGCTFRSSNPEIQASTKRTFWRTLRHDFDVRHSSQIETLRITRSHCCLPRTNPNHWQTHKRCSDCRRRLEKHSRNPVSSVSPRNERFHSGRSR